MATILFIGGVAPDLNQEQLIEAFAKVGVAVLASSVVRHAGSQRCIGQAYVTVAEDSAATAVERVTTIGSNAVVVLPVSLEAWVAPEAVAPAPAPAAAAAGGTQPTPSAAAAAAAPAPAAPAFMAPAAPAFMAPAPAAPVPMAVDGGGPAVNVPYTSESNAHLRAALEQLRSHLQSNPRLACNGKPFAMLLHEAAQKRQLGLQAAEAAAEPHEGGGFACTLSLGNAAAGGTLCSGRGVGANKKDAKHNAAAACLDAMLAAGQLLPRELIAGMTTGAAAPPAAAPPGGAGFGAWPVAAGGASNAAAVAAAQTQAILQLGLYPRCAEVMSVVHASEAGRAKTILMVLNEFAMRNRLTVQHEDVSHPASGPLAGAFRFATILTDPARQEVVRAHGVELRNKQEAKQAAAAAAVEALLARGIATVDSLTRGK